MSRRQGQAEVVGKRAGSFKKGSHYKVGRAEVIAAVESLYDDKIQPNGRILLKRVGERAVCNTSTGQSNANCAEYNMHRGDPPYIPPKYLRNVCETCDALRVERAEGGDYTAHLIHRPFDFVDPCSPVDFYPPSMWNEFAEYIWSLAGEELYLPGGRYACAVELQARQLGCFASLTLGHISHIVQLAISQKRLLGYYKGSLVPYNMSEMGTKEQCAFFQTPSSLSTGSCSTLPLASWEQTRDGLREILKTSGSVALPNVKRIFRARFGLCLSETLFGHPRLFELLQDPCLQDICTLQLQGKSWIVVESTEIMASCCASPANDCWEHSGPSNCMSTHGDMSGFSTSSGEDTCSARSEDLDSTDGTSSHGAGPSRDDESLLEEILAIDGTVGATVKNTFIHIMPSLTFVRQRSRSLPDVYTFGVY